MPGGYGVSTDLSFGGRIDVGRGLRLTSDGIYNLPWEQVAAFQLPLPQQIGSGDRKLTVLGVAWDSEGSLAWLLTGTGRLLGFSTETGRLVEEIKLGGASECLSSSSLPSFEPRMADAPRAQRLFVRLTEGKGCSFVVDTGAATVRSVPLEIARAFALSADGLSLAVDADGFIKTYSLETNSEIAAFETSVQNFVLSETGEAIVGLFRGYGEELAGGYLHNHEGGIWYKSPAGKELGPTVRFPDDPYRDEAGPVLEAGARLVASENRLLDYTGREVATVETRGRQAIVRYSDGAVETFGVGARDSLKCFVGAHLVPLEFCQLKFAKGRLEQLIGGLPTNGDTGARYADGPAKKHCNEPIFPCGKPISSDTEQFECWSGEPIDRSELECLAHPRSMMIHGQEFSALSSPQNLKGLTSLSLRSVGTFDVASLRNAPSLQRLVLREVSVTNLDGVASCPGLTFLDVSGAQVTALEPLRSLTNLEELDLSQTLVSNLAPLAGLQDLKRLHLSGTQVKDLLPLTNLPNLQRLELLGLRLEDVSPLLLVPNLRFVSVTRGLLSPEEIGRLEGAGISVTEHRP